MDIRVGWSTEYGKTKFDVSMDETDLERLLMEEDIPQDQWQLLTTSEVFKILDAEVNRYSVFAAMEHGVLDKAQGIPKLEESKAARKARFDALRDRLSSV